MAARKNKGTFDKPWDDKVRVKIQTSMLVNRLTAFVKGEVKMEAPQVTAALGLLKKSLPDLSSIEAKHDVSDALSDLLKAVDGRTRGIPKSG